MEIWQNLKTSGVFQEAQLHGPAAPDDISAVYQVQMILMFEWVEKLAEFQQIADPHDKVHIFVYCIVIHQNSFLLKNVFLVNPGGTSRV